MFPARFLILAVADDEGIEAKIRQLDLARLIIRRLSYCLELDFRSAEIEGEISGIGRLCRIIAIERVDDDTPSSSTLSTEEYNSLIREVENCMKKERYWKAHTILEKVWNIEDGDRKLGFQTIIWLLASLVHYQMGEIDTATEMYSKSRKRLRDLGFLNIVDQLGDEFSYPRFIDLSSLRI